MSAFLVSIEGQVDLHRIIRLHIMHRFRTLRDLQLSSILSFPVLHLLDEPHEAKVSILFFYPDCCFVHGVLGSSRS